MRSLPKLVAVSSLMLSLVVAGPPADADPVTTALRAAHLAPADPPGGSSTAPSTTDAAPLLGDVAGPAREVTLPELLTLAVQQSPSLAKARIDRDLAAIALLSAQTWGDWTVEAGLDASSRRLGGVVDRQTAVGLSGDLGRKLSTGGTVGLHAEAGWQSTKTQAGATVREYTETVTVGLVQPLMRGRGEALVRASERAARHDQTAAALAERAAAIAEVQAVVLQYLDLVDAENNLAIQRSSLELARERLRVTSAGIKAGGVAESETIAVEQAIATREEAALSGELAILSASLAVRRKVGLPIGPGETALSSKIDLAIPARTWDAAALVAAAMAQSPELARLAALDAGATIDIEVTENGVLPSLDLALTLGPSGTADDPAEAAKNLVTFDEFTAVGSLTYRTTLGQRAARAATRSVRTQRETIRVNDADLRRQIAQAVTVAVAQAQAAERRFAIATRASQLAERNLGVEQARLALGRSRNVDVLIRQDELRAAQLRASQAVIDWHRASTAIAALTGEILPGYGIELRDR